MTLERARRDAGFAFAVPGSRASGTRTPCTSTKAACRSSTRPARDCPRSAETGAGLLITESRATVGRYIQKSAGMGTRVERLQIGGDPAFHLSGEPHGFAYQLEGQDVRFEEQRLAGPTLLVEHDGLLVRIEGRISRERAIAIAETITAAVG